MRADIEGNVTSVCSRTEHHPITPRRTCTTNDEQRKTRDGMEMREAGEREDWVAGRKKCSHLSCFKQPAESSHKATVPCLSRSEQWTDKVQVEAQRIRRVGKADSWVGLPKSPVLPRPPRRAVLTIRHQSLAGSSSSFVRVS
ncbi:unnamed protein product [Pleuronectes platessa]|uniref:Uncharacterized protein n=1 Tax=Pleuronectes platessa TaxID=8262 RepID=A0A9N7UXZ5_PLEPL|nr:unnamed protein product [Pleuronectes platessa]